MPSAHSKTLRAAINDDTAALYASLELSLSTWLVTSLAPGTEKMSKHRIEGGDSCGLLDLLQQLQSKAAKRLGAPVRIVTIQEAGLDGFWVDRLLQAEDIESHVVDPASVAVPRRRRRAKTDKVAEDTSPGKLLLQLRSIGPEIASGLWLEGLYRHFDNRRQLAAFSGLAPSPWRSGKIDHEQGIAKSGNAKLRSTMIELSWLWLRYQPGSELSRWFRTRVQGNNTRRYRKITIVAMARKLLIALWRYVTGGVVPEGAVMKAG